MSQLASPTQNKPLKKQAQWRVYKPKKSNDGAASKLECKVVTFTKEKDGQKYPVRKVQVFWVSAQQTGTDANDNASFGWEDEAKRVTLKLGEVDLGEILAVLNNKKDVAGAVGDKFKGIFHKNEKGNASFLLERKDTGYYLRVSKKIGTAPAIAVTHQISFGEGEILRIVVESAVRLMYQW
jgi:hypothetical protein